MMNWGAWLYGLFSAFIGAFATAATGALTMPGVFNFSHNGLINFLKISVTPAIIAFFAYLQQHPVPTETTTLKQTKTTDQGTTDTTVVQTKTSTDSKV
jgi:hypothetical protein